MNTAEHSFVGTGFSISTKPEIGQLEVTRFPDRTEIALCVTKGAECYVLGWFQTDRQAETFVNWLRESYRTLGVLP